MDEYSISHFYFGVNCAVEKISLMQENQVQAKAAALLQECFLRQCRHLCCYAFASGSAKVRTGAASTASAASDR